MESQQLQDHHMRLPPPITGTGKSIGGSASANDNSSVSATTTTTPTAAPTANSAANSAATHGPATDSPVLHKTSHQHMHPGQQTYPRPVSSLSPQFKTANTGPFYGFGSNHHPPTSSPLSPRLLGPVPAHAPPSYTFSQTQAQTQSQPQNHDPTTLEFPDPPSTELAPLQPNAHENRIGSLPSLAYLTGAAASNSSRRFAPSSATSDPSQSPPPLRPRGWPTGNPYSVYYTGGHGHTADSPARMDSDTMNNGMLSPDAMHARASSVSLDDPDVRMAAEALGDLKADFISSPRNKTTNPPASPNHFGTPGPSEAEPLLSLVMTSGSLLAKPIEGTVSAYNTTKNFSPGFIKTPVEYVEGVVGSGLHLSGIEGGVRWFFRGKGRHQAGDLESGANSHKRRKVDIQGGSMSASRRGEVPPLTSLNFLDTDMFDKDRRLSLSTIDTLPAYDDARSPAYTENVLASPNETGGPSDGRATPTASRPSSTTPSAWQSRLIMSTSGLSIAMSEESLRSLKYCLNWLRWANDHIGRVISALKDALEKYDSEHAGLVSDGDHAMEGDVPHHLQDPEEARRELGARITALRSDVLRTLQGVIATVSKYAGGALPDNARALVRRHLTSLPQRFHMATQESVSASAGDSPAPTSSTTSKEGKEKEMREGAQRVLVLAKEGLDMMAQVSGVLDGTIVSAEEWCERLGRKKRDGREQTTSESGSQAETQQAQQEQEYQPEKREVQVEAQQQHG